MEKEKGTFETFDLSLKSCEKNIQDLDSESLQKFSAVESSGHELKKQMDDITVSELKTGVHHDDDDDDDDVVRPFLYWRSFLTFSKSIHTYPLPLLLYEFVIYWFKLTSNNAEDWN